MLRLLFVFLGLVVWAACGSDEAAALCEPGETQVCVGPGSCDGGQICLQDGSGWGACDCGGVGQGGGQGCDQGSCDDDNPCTADSCSAGSCSHDPIDGESELIQQVEGDCRRVQCSAGNADLIADDGDIPVDDNPCTADACSVGEASNPPEAGGTACDHDGGSVCNGQGGCVECFSNADCTPSDTCGGGGTPWTCGCTPISCADLDLTCGYSEDDGCGDTLFCNNHIQDGDETNVDCGGSVNTCSTRCNVGQGCTTNPDCATNKCTAGSCQ